MGPFFRHRRLLAAGIFFLLGLVAVALLARPPVAEQPVGTPSLRPLPTTSPIATPLAAATPSPATRTIQPTVPVFLPSVVQRAPEGPTPPPQPAIAAQPTVPAAPPPTAAPEPTPRPIRITKLGLGVYDSGGAMIPDLEAARPSVILLMDPTVDFARDVRRRFPKAFIVGRIFAKDQPLDNPAARGVAFADRVAASAVPLKGIVDAWMSYNEVTDGSNKNALRAWNEFQVAFARKLQEGYGIDAVAGNDATNSISAEDFARYLAESVSVSKYFGVHAYPGPHIRSLRDPAGHEAIYFYRRIHQALVGAGVKKDGKYLIITEVGLWDGWRGVTGDAEMGADFICYAERLNQDPYVVGATVYGLFVPGRWDSFNIAGSAILRLLGDYNSEGFDRPPC